MSKKLLFVINGFGMGNATRCYSLIEILGSEYEIDVMTSDRAFLYFQNLPLIQNVFKQNDINLTQHLKYGSLKYYTRYIPHFINRLFVNYSFQKKIISSKDYAF
jgi:hypothetical protein